MRYLLGILLCFFIEITNAQNYLQITPEEALEIGVKIWYNECAGTDSGLTTWNQGENFASLGIGHFIWYPYGRPHVYSESFPELLNFLQAHGVTIPAWLQDNLAASSPWNNREEFLAAEDSPQMIELREFLMHTIPQQAEFIIYRTQNLLPRMIESMPVSEQSYVEAQIQRLAQTPLGVYAIVDYINFKGAGVTSEGTYDEQGWGLLEVIENMKHAPLDMTSLQAFVWSANEVLTRRVTHEPRYRHDWMWLDGWRNRLRTYLG